MTPLLNDPDLQRILAALPQARIAGGAVRDALANCPVADIDLATPEPPEQVIARLLAAGLHPIPTGLAHGTITAISNHRAFEITTLRRDVSTDGRHAEVAWTDNWRQDAARRDFTINAMLLDRDGRLHDYFHGAADLIAGRVRFVGDAAQRIREDYLRILRFFRFYGRYGTPPPDEAAIAAIAANLDGLARLSAERVCSELKKILAAPDPAPAILLMDRLGVLDAILPEGTAPARLVALAAAGAPPDPLLRFAALFNGTAEDAAARLKLSNAEAETLHAITTAPVANPEDDDRALLRLLADHAVETLIAATWLAPGHGAVWDSLRARLAALPRPVFPLEGRDALALGAAPGPAIGHALRETRAWWLDRGCSVAVEELMGVFRKNLLF